MLQLFRGDVVTMDAHRPFGTGILAEDGVIREVGEFEALKDRAPGAAVEDYGDAAILPGFIDGHSHLSAVAYESILFDARPESGCRSVEELVRLGQKYLREHALSEGQWMLGMGYDNGVFPGEAHPTRFDLDRISEEIPIAVTHVSGHLCAVNSRAMEILGYDGPDPQVPEGGEVDPSGLLKEEAFSDLKVRQAMKGPDVNQLMEGTRQAARLYASYGITTMQDARTGEEEYRLLLLAGKSGALSGDVVCYLTPEAAEKWLPRQNPALNAYKDHCRMAGAKIFLDGSPQGKTAWLSRPYARVPEGKPAGYRGFPVRRPEDVTWFFGHCKMCIRDRYYAIQCEPAILTTLGGLQITNCAEVMNEEEIIPGLFAAGDVAGGIHGSSILDGDYVTAMLVFGRTAGTEAAGVVD